MNYLKKNVSKHCVYAGRTIYPKSIRTFAHEEFSCHTWLFMPLIAVLEELRQKEHGESIQHGLEQDLVLKGKKEEDNL